MYLALIQGGRVMLYLRSRTFRQNFRQQIRIWTEEAITERLFMNIAKLQLRKEDDALILVRQPERERLVPCLMEPGSAERIDHRLRGLVRLCASEQQRSLFGEGAMAPSSRTIGYDLYRR